MTTSLSTDIMILKGGINLKDFNEFWETLTNDDVNEIIDKINELISDTHPDSLAENLGNSMMAVSLTVTKTILEKYHLWISE